MDNKNHFLKNTLYSVVGYGMLIIGNLAFNFFAARSLGTVDYGIYMSFFYLLIALTQPVNSFQLAVAKYTAENSLSRRDAFREVTPTLLIFSAIVLAFFTMAMPVMKNLYNLPNVWISPVGGGVVIFWLSLAVYRGIYQGEMDFKTYGINLAVEGILRAVFGIVLILVGWRIFGAVSASIFSGIVGVGLLFWPPRRELSFKNLPMSFNKKLFKEVLFAFLILMPFGLLMNLDLTLVQNIVGGEESGLISACGLFGKNLIILSMVIANVVFSHTLNESGKNFWRGILLAVLIFAAAVLGVEILGEWMVNLLFGSDYLPMMEYFIPYLVATFPLLILQHVVNDAIARENRRVMVFLWIALIACAGIFTLILKNDSLKNFLWWMTGVLSLVDIIAFFLNRTPQKQSAQ